LNSKEDRFLYFQFQSADGTKYQGEMFKGKFHGIGTYTYPDLKRYEGGWLGGKPDQEGTIYL